METTKNLLRPIALHLTSALERSSGFFLTPNFQHEVLLFTTFGLTVLFFI
jgi:hypothetical protein